MPQGTQYTANAKRPKKPSSEAKSFHSDNEPLRKEQHVAMIGAIKIHYLLLFKAYVDRRLNIIPTWKESPVGAIPTTHPHELPYFDPPIPSDPFNAPILCSVKFRYIERHASNTVTNYPSDKPLLPLLDTFLPGKTPLLPSRTLNNLTYILNESGTRFIEHPTTWDPEYEFLPSVLRVYAQTIRGDIIPIDGRSVSTLDDVFEQVRQIDADRSDDQRTYLDLVCATVNLFTFRKESEVERKWLNGEFKNPEDLGDPKYIVSERVNNLTDERARDFCYGDPEFQGTNYPGTFSWTAREGILDLLSRSMGDDEASSESGSSSH
ncbi:hypothetical protein RhiJN_27407 [Ceratobasidium sp. AG-Ba]|nr:hypothetical protein RhiJN_13335 [Ceratobasidium sp. AG-Ba]QRV99388.1 hypothetical protein RhiJN_27407 [Ceratobasidium sp. AG-Ba]QRW13892.1 hypothetical protein RhiLY_12891 [Ceratobasidium sp. AG-Ba]